MTARGTEAAALAHLLALFTDITQARTLTLADWDTVLRLGRQARLLGVLHERVAAAPGIAGLIPAPVHGHLRAARNYTAYRRQLLLLELDALGRALPADLPVVLLKGSAYIARDLPMARGRLPNDVDLMVHRDHLDTAERALKQAGWAFQSINDHDERYYRQWSHELPPLRYPGHPLEVDLHHTITPVTGRVRPDLQLLFGDLQSVSGQRWQVLHPHDQIIHAALHLFQDSDLSGNLRELVDIDGLIRTHVRDPADWQSLARRTRQHGAEAAVWYALAFCRRWLGLNPPDDLQLTAPAAWSRALTSWTYARAGPPRVPDRPAGPTRRLAQTVGLARYHLLRMPPGLLARHLAVKTFRRLRFRWGTA